MREKNGFTLVELLVTIAMLAVVGTIIIYNTINLSNDTKDLQYERMVENVQDATRTYVSLYPQEFADLYNQRGFTYIKVERLIEESLIDEDMENPYTKEKINPDDLIKVYVDGTSYEMVYVYPVREEDKNTEISLVSSELTALIQDGVSDPIYLYSGIERTYTTTSLSLINEDGTLISIDPTAASPETMNVLNYYKSEQGYNFSGTFSTNTIKQCKAKADNATTLVCGTKEYADYVTNGKVAGDYYYATKAGSYYITYKWELPGKDPTKKRVRSQTRKITVLDFSDEAQHQATSASIESNMTQEIEKAEDPYKANAFTIKNIEFDENNKLNGQRFSSKIVDTGVQLFKTDIDWSIVMTASETDAATGVNRYFFQAMMETPTTGVDRYPGVSLSDAANNQLRMCAGGNCVYFGYVPEQIWKIVIYRNREQNEKKIYYGYCANYDIARERCKAGYDSGAVDFKYIQFTKNTYLGAGKNDASSNAAFRYMSGYVYDFRMYNTWKAGEYEISLLK